MERSVGRKSKPLSFNVRRMKQGVYLRKGKLMKLPGAFGKGNKLIMQQPDPYLDLEKLVSELERRKKDGEPFIMQPLLMPNPSRPRTRRRRKKDGKPFIIQPYLEKFPPINLPHINWQPIRQYSYPNYIENEISPFIKKSLTYDSVIVLTSGANYIIYNFISASGAFSVVFRSTMISNGKQVAVALKVQRAEMAYYEAKILSTFKDNKHIVNLIDVGEIEQLFDLGTNYVRSNPFSGQIILMNGERIRLACLVVEFIDGVTLENLIKNTPISINKAVRIIRQICDAVECFHNLGYIHLDLKPSNIMIDRQGIVKIVDMGSVIQKGNYLLAIGNGPYAAPEIKEFVINQPNTLASIPCPFDETSDVFSVAAIFYSMLTSRNNFRIENKYFVPILERALQTDPKVRTKTCYDLRCSIMTVFKTKCQLE